MECITPNEQQSEAITKGVKWFKKRKKQVFEIAGFAGTGKTTLVRWILEACNISVDEGLYVAFVGKAAMVLSMRGLPARTIHSAIYECIDVPKLDKNGKFVMVDDMVVMTKKFIKKDKLPDNIKVIIVDEGSMVDEKLFNDLKSFGKPIIVLGDLHQLPPVFGSPACLKHPDVVLTQIMRQAEENPIIHFATMAREHRWDEFKCGSYQDRVFIVPQETILKHEDIIRNSEVIICGYNNTREKLNHYIRKNIYHMEGDIALGEKMICRENNWSRRLDDNIFLINGMIGYVQDIDYESFNKRTLDIDFRPDFVKDKCFHSIPIDWKYLHLDYLTKRNYQSSFDKFEYGYAITCHLAQGSQYDSVLLINENLHRGKDFYSKWLYVGCSRAINKLIIAI